MKTILIIGASGGIGRACAKYFLDSGWRVIGTNFKNDFQSYLKSDKNFTGLRLDITDEDSLIQVSSGIDEIDVLLNCSGVIDFESYNEPEKAMKIWQDTIAVNLTGAYLVFEHFKYKLEKGGSYIMMSSTDSHFGGKINRAYAVSKAGINSLTKSLALLAKDSGIRVNSIAPGWVETAMMEAGGDALAEYAKQINPMQRNGTPDDVAQLVKFLSSRDSNYINGQIINLDGGYTLQDLTLMFEEDQIKNNKGLQL